MTNRTSSTALLRVRLIGGDDNDRFPNIVGVSFIDAGGQVQYVDVHVSNVIDAKDGQ